MLLLTYNLVLKQTQMGEADIPATDKTQGCHLLVYYIMIEVTPVKRLF